MRQAILALAALAAFIGRASALTPRNLNPQELARYETIKSDPRAAESFLATRDYVRKAAAVVAAPRNKRLALELKRPKSFNERFLLAGDAEKINAAVELSLNALAETVFA